MENLRAIFKKFDFNRVFPRLDKTLTLFFRCANTFTDDEKLLPYASRFDAISLAAL